MTVTEYFFMCLLITYILVFLSDCPGLLPIFIRLSFFLLRSSLCSGGAIGQISFAQLLYINCPQGSISRLCVPLFFALSSVSLSQWWTLASHIAQYLSGILDRYSQLPSGWPKDSVPLTLVKLTLFPLPDQPCRVCSLLLFGVTVQPGIHAVKGGSCWPFPCPHSHHFSTFDHKSWWDHRHLYS